MSEVQGRYRGDVRFGELPDDYQPGDIWRYTNHDTNNTPVSAKNYYRSADVSGNLTDEVWGFASPDGNGIGTLGLHTVRLHEDGTFSILPGDGSSNSVLHSGGPDNKTWHGYVYNGVWREC